MFLFITVLDLKPGVFANLNTSHVLIYPASAPWGYSIASYLNTSHVLIYHFSWQHPSPSNLNLNTSHVLIYQYSKQSRHRLDIFKYISCSYLSGKKIKAHAAKQGFKYISCSYLSIQKMCIPGFCYYLNTSHVLIYPVIENELVPVYENLNTSHVLIYQTA